MKNTDLARFSVSISQELLDEFESYVVKRGITKNRSEVMRDIIREAIDKDLLIEDPQAVVAGTLTMVYDHHSRNLSHKIIEIQHQHNAEIISSMHVHMDHHNCLEVVVLKGKVCEIKSIADKILGIKGVFAGSLTLAPIENRGAHRNAGLSCELHSHVHTSTHSRLDKHS